MSRTNGRAAGHANGHLYDEMMPPPLTEEEIAALDRDGFVPSLDPGAPGDDDKGLVSGPLSVSAIQRIIEERGRGISNPSTALHGLRFGDDFTVDTNTVDIVDGVIVEGSGTVIWGWYNVGKTFFAIALAVHIALGRMFFGRETEERPVLYVSYEGKGGRLL